MRIERTPFFLYFDGVQPGLEKWGDRLDALYGPGVKENIHSLVGRCMLDPSLKAPPGFKR